MSKLFIELKKCLRENFTLQELKQIAKMLDIGQGLGVFRRALDSTIEFKECDENLEKFIKGEK